MPRDVHAALASLDLPRARSLVPLSGGCIASVLRVTFNDGSSAVVKHDAAASGLLQTEAMMLRYLTEHSRLPVPRVIACSVEALVLEDMPGRTGCGPEAQQHAAELLAALHEVRAPAFGFERPTLIGSLDQMNPWTDSWVEFFAQHRLIAMAEACAAHGAISRALAGRIRSLAGRLHEFIDEPSHPSLIHGDAWSGNVLAENPRVTAFIDPAIYYANPEVELAFMSLFGCFGRPFYERYHELRPIRAGFFETSRDVYNLYPLLVHARLFGGGYAGSIDRTVKKLES